ncbi:ATP-binding protein [Streptomyces sp. S1A]|uniref:ATP-binding protein n=1 Tax=Streptomyces chitinivorans TaxID=1257027 RepID=A0ABW7HYP7_9ACTN|nr:MULTISPECIES: ATP-binding protein [Streptomyces]MCG3040677.1 ATP-binding protein [Streptomyces sp. ICN903]MDH2409093.1 ATP-binding protein [Streptomyces chitinivorans]
MISHPSTSGRQRTVEFQALPSRAGQIRRIVSALLRYWKLDPLVGPAADGVAELLAGSRRQAGADGRCTVEIALLLDRLTISVRDHPPQLSPAHALGAFPMGGPQPAPGGLAAGGEAARITLPVPAPAAPAPAAPAAPAPGAALPPDRPARPGPLQRA